MNMDNNNPARMSIRPSSGESGIRLSPEIFKVKLLQMTDETLESLYEIWKVAGYEEIECQRLLGDLLAKFKVTCATEIAAEEKILEHAKIQVDENVKALTKMNEQLGRVTDVSYIENFNFTDKLAELEKLLQDLEVEVSGRQSLIDKEMNGIMALVRELGENSPSETMFSGPPGTPLLSDARLNLMKDYKKELEQLRVKRIEEVQTLARECYNHMNDLMYSEEGFSTMSDSQQYLPLDKQVVKYVKTNDFSLGISKKDVVALTLRFKRFLEEKERRRSELEKTGADIAKYWSLLRIPSVEREQFQNSFKKNLSMETLNKGYEELKRLRDIRRRSLGRVVSSIRSDILTLWEEAGIDSEENRKREFPAYFADIDNLDDSAVDLHDSYFQSLRKRVEELKPILIKISRRETVLQERIELEHLQMNPERLTARGPNAREERKREEAMANRVKNLEKLTKEIVNQIQTWEDGNGPFMYGGERYLERIPRQEEIYIEIKESLRSARKKNNQKYETITMPPPASTTRSVSNKRQQNTLTSSSSTPNTPYSATKGRLVEHANAVFAAANSAFAPTSSVPASAIKDTENLSSNIRCTSNDSEATSATLLKGERSSNSSDTVVQQKN